MHQENSVVQYDTIDWVINLVQQYGPYFCLIAKIDIEDAFRIIPINPSDYHLMGFSWEEKKLLWQMLAYGNQLH